MTKEVWTKAEEHAVKIEKEYCKENCMTFLVSVAEKGMLCCVR
jgi:hypothetical protein